MDRGLSDHILDVFTEVPCAGNPLAVVLGAGGRIVAVRISTGRITPP